MNKKHLKPIDLKSGNIIRIEGEYYMLKMSRYIQHTTKETPVKKPYLTKLKLSDLPDLGYLLS